MQRKDYPNAAFAYVSEDEATRLLRHHGSSVSSADEHASVDPLLLAQALELVEVIPVSDETRKKVRSHLQAHANIVLWTDPDTAGLPIALHDKLRDTAFFKANLDGTGEVPPVTTEARGTVYATLNKKTNEFNYWVEFVKLSTAQVESHFHRGLSGKMGEVALPFESGSPVIGSQVVTDDFVKDLYEGRIYCNIHSEAHPTGEIRGMLVPSAVSRSNNAHQEEAVKKTTKDNGPRRRSDNRSVVTSLPGKSDSRGDKMGKEKKKGEKDKKDEKKGVIESFLSDTEAAQVAPPKEKDPKAQTPTIHQQGDKGAVYSKEGESADAKQVVPPDSPPRRPKPSRQVRPDEQGPAKTQPPSRQVKPPAEKKPKAQKYEGLQTEKDRKSGDGGPEVIKAPKEVKPKAKVRKLDKKGDKGAVYSRDGEKKGKKEKKPKAQVKKTDAPVYSSTFDIAQVAVNVDTRPLADPRSAKTRQSIMEFGNGSGAPNPPKVSVSNLKDRNNADLRKAIESQDHGSAGARPGEGNEKLDRKVVQFMTEDDLDSRTILLPSTGSEEDWAVLRVEASEESQRVVNELPDAAFAAIGRGGRKDLSGRTSPRSLRHLPHHSGSVQATDESSSLDLLQLRNSLARIDLIEGPSESETARLRRVACSHLVRHAKKVMPKSKFANSSRASLSQILTEVDIAICRAAIDEHIPVVKAQLLKVEELGSTTLMSLEMGTKENSRLFFVSLKKDGDKKVRSVVFDFDTHLPGGMIPDFIKFLKTLDIQKA